MSNWVYFEAAETTLKEQAVAEIKIEDYSFRTDEITKITRDYVYGKYMTVVSERFCDDVYLDTPVCDVVAIIRKAEEKEQRAKEDALAKKVAENLFDMIKEHEAQKEEKQRAKPKATLKIG